MVQQMYRMWWKWSATVLILFSIVVGMAIPVGPGIKNVSPVSSSAAQPVVLQIKGYNTHFSAAKSTLQVFLRNKDLLLCAAPVGVLANDRLSAHFDLPSFTGPEESRVFDLIISNDHDGTFGLVECFRMVKSESGGREHYCQPAKTYPHPNFLNFPYRNVLYETIRNLFYHVPMWFAMTFILLVSLISSIAYLSTGKQINDIIAFEAVNTGILFGIIGFLTGAVWGSYTWGKLNEWLLSDTKILGALLGLLVYFAYLILRGSLEDNEKRAKISAVYNIFAFSMFLAFIFVIPRISNVATLHPGSGGNPAFKMYDVDGNMIFVFYPAVLGWILFSLWVTSVRVRWQVVRNKLQI